MSQPKAFVPIAGRAMLYYSLRAIAAVPEIVEAVITLPPGMESAARRLVHEAGLGIPVKLTPGGPERHDSVRIGLGLTSVEAEIVVVHDAARPLAGPTLFSACIAAAARSGGAIAVMPLADTLKVVEGAMITATRPRTGLYRAQTPQAFRRGLLIAAHERAIAARGRAPIATDDAELVERIGGQVEVVEGAESNLKITTLADLELATALITSRAID
jgi:2-C-methyl-D-erythritol 4-phosphate cytidylyltransferase